jgi:hypothetical protein
MIHWHAMIWIWIRDISVVLLPTSLFHVENRVSLSRGVQVTGAAWWVETRIVAGVGDLVQMTRDGQAQVGYSVTGRSRGWVTLCSVCTMHKETRSTGFLVEPQNQGRWFVSGLASKLLGRFVNDLTSKSLGRFVSSLPSKPLRRFVSGLASKPLGQFLSVWPPNRWWQFLLIWPQNRWRRVSRFGYQNCQLRFDNLGFKITAMVSWLGS